MSRPTNMTDKLMMLAHGGEELSELTSEEMLQEKTEMEETPKKSYDTHQASMDFEMMIGIQSEPSPARRTSRDS